MHLLFNPLLMLFCSLLMLQQAVTIFPSKENTKQGTKKKLAYKAYPKDKVELSPLLDPLEPLDEQTHVGQRNLGASVITVDGGFDGAYYNNPGNKDKSAADFEKDEAFEYLVQPFSRTIPLELRERLKMLRSILIKGEFIYDYELMVTLMLIKFNKDKNLREFPIGDRMLAVGREVRHPLDFLLYLQKRLDTLIRVLTFENPELNKKPAKPSKKGSVRSKSPVQ